MLLNFSHYWANVCKKVCSPVLSDRCLSVVSCPSVCSNVGVLSPNGWMDQDETWHRGRPCVRWEPNPQGAQPPFSAHFCCSQTAGSIKMPLGREVDIGTGDNVLDGDPAPPERGTSAPSSRPMSIVAKRSPISATAEHLQSFGFYNFR